MSIFGNLGTEGLEEAQDRLGGFSIKPTDAYLATIKVAYAGKSSGGAQSVTVVADIGGADYSETVYVTNKKGENFFLNPNDKTKKVALPGFTTINDLCIVTTEKPLASQDTEEKTVKIYDYEAKKELPTVVPVLVDLIGKQAWFGIVAQTVDRQKKNESSGEYEPTGETRDENVIEKIFHEPTKMTVVEATEAAKTGNTPDKLFFDAWVAKNKDVTRNRAKGAGSGGKSGRPESSGSAPTSGGETKATKSLFGK